MKILFVVPNVPSVMRPRPFNFIRRLSRSHEVSVLCVATNEGDHRFASELKQHCQALEVITLPRWRSFWSCLTALFSSKALRCAYFYSPYVHRTVKEKIQKKEIDLVHAEDLKSVAMVDGVAGEVPIVFDAVDCVSMFQARRTKATRNPLLKAFFWTEWKKMAWWEEKAVERFDHIVISSAVDKGSYPVPTSLKERIHVIPNAVDLDYFGFRRVEPQKNLLVFSAKLDYAANADAALYFSRSLWPLLLARRPNLELQIVGSRPPRSLRQLDGKGNIRVIASVPDVRPFVGRAWVVLCPLRVQAGTQFKILQAMALGVPVVATRICCPGLKAEAGKHLLVADTPEEYVSAIESLLDNEGRRSNLVEAARKYVEEHHDWENSVKTLSDVYAQAVADFDASRSLKVRRGETCTQAAD